METIPLRQFAAWLLHFLILLFIMQVEMDAVATDQPSVRPID